MDEVAPENAPGPCAGFKVLEFGTMVSAPLASQSLGDLGADVIKVETLIGDTSRWTGKPERAGINGFFSQFNRNKRAISVNMKTPEGIEVVRRLAREADVIVCNYRPGVAERLGFGYETLKEDNPGLVYVAVTGFGGDGPYSERPAYDFVIQGMSGTMMLQGRDGPPQMIQSVIADKCAAVTAASAALGALLARERNGGKGQYVEVPMINAYAQVALPDMLTHETFRPKETSATKIADIFKVWECSDGFIVGMPIEDKQYAGLCRALGREEFIADERFVSIAARMLNTDDLFGWIQAELIKRTCNEALEAINGQDVPFAPVYELEDFMADAQVQHNRTIFDAEDPQGGTTRYVRHPTVFEDTPATLRRHPPRPGEHTDEILGEAGFSGEEIAAMRSSKVVV